MAVPLDPRVPGIAVGYHERLAPRLLGPWTGELLSRVPLRPGARVVDLACGSGLLARAVPEAASLVVGVDAWDEMVALARRHAASPRHAWTVGDFHDLPLRDGGFDALFCQQGLQFADDADEVLAEARRVLRPGGRAGFAVWADLGASPGFRHLREEVAALWGEDAAPDVEMPPPLDRPEALQKALERAGFVEVRVERLSRDLRFPDARGFLLDFIAGSSLLDVAPGKPPREQQDLLDGLTRRLAPWMEPEGLRFPIHAHLATGVVPTSGD